MQSPRQAASLQRQELHERQILLQRGLSGVNLASGPEAVLAECRRIRRCFAKELGSIGTTFTFFFEFDALVALGLCKLAWRQLLLMERQLGNRRLDIATDQWSLEEAWRALHFYAPLLYLQGRYGEARHIMELGLNPWFDGSRRRHKDLFLYIGNRDRPPRVRQRVTLFHIYQALGESLVSWGHWSEFVRTVPVEILRNGAVSRRELLEDPARIVNLHSHARGGEA
jgi:hypothetical protein